MRYILFIAFFVSLKTNSCVSPIGENFNISEIEPANSVFIASYNSSRDFEEAISDSTG